MSKPSLLICPQIVQSFSGGQGEGEVWDGNLENSPFQSRVHECFAVIMPSNNKTLKFYQTAITEARINELWCVLQSKLIQQGVGTKYIQK